MVVYSNSICFCSCIDYWHFSVMISVVHVSMCLLYFCLVLLSKSAESFFDRWIRLLVHVCVWERSSTVLLLRPAPLVWTSSSWPSWIRQLHVLTSPQSHTLVLSLFLFLSLWSGLGQGQCKNRVHKDDRKDVSVCVSESTCCRWCAIFTTLNSSLRRYICF